MKAARRVAGGVTLLLVLVLLGRGRDGQPTRRTPRRSAVAPMCESVALPVPENVVPQEIHAGEEIPLDLKSSDPAERADAVDALTANRPDEAPAILEQILASDPDSRVRERAVLAYADRLGAKAVPVIRRSALTDPDEDVASTARAALDFIRSEHPEPARGWLAAEVPGSFMAGETTTVWLRFGSSVDAPEVTLGVELPKGVELISPESSAWKGSVQADRVEELCLRLRVTADSVDAPLGVSLKLDYLQELDVDVLRKDFKVAMEDGRGRLIALP